MVVIDDAVLILKVHGVVRQILQLCGHDEFANRRLRAGCFSSGQGGHRAQPGELDTFGVDVPIGEALAKTWVLQDSLVAAANLRRQCDELFVVRALGAANGQTLRGQRRQGHFPAAVDCTDALLVRNPHVAEIDFIETAFSRNLMDRAHFNARALHIDPEHGHAVVLSDRRVGASE